MRVTSRIGTIVGALVALAGSAEARPSRRPTCITRTARVYQARFEGARLTLCFERGGPRSCWQLDVSAAPPAWTAAAPTALPAVGPCGSMLCAPTEPPPAARLTLATLARVCAPDGSDCRSVTTPPRPPAPDADLTVTVSEDRGLLALSLDEARATVIDVTTGAVLSTTAPWVAPDTGLGWSAPRPRFVGARLLLLRSDGVRTRGRLVDPRSGATLAPLAEDRHLDRSPPVRAGAALVVATADGEALAFHDVVSGKLARTVPLFGAPRGAAATLALLAVTADQARVIAVRSEGDGTVATVDATTGSVTSVPPPPACP